MTNEFLGKRIGVVGLAATGLATARVLASLGAKVILYDRKPAGDLPADRVRDAGDLDGVQLALGGSDDEWDALDLLVPSPGVPRNAPIITHAVARGVPVSGEIEIAYHLAKAPILAITGTNGKTTTTALLGAICRTAGLQTWVAGNIAEDAGVRAPLIEAAIHAPEDGVIVAEISSFQLEWVQEFRPKVGAWLNMANDHFDRYSGMDDYARAKANLFRAQTADDFAVYNWDDPIVSDGITQAAVRARRVPFSLESRQAYGAYEAGGDLFLALPDELHLLPAREIRLPGKHNVANVLAAAAMARLIGIDIGSIRTAVRQFTGVAHRMEYIGSRDGVRFVNNSMCTNPAAVWASLEAVEGPTIAIVGGKHKGGDLTGLIDALRRYARHVVLIGASAREIGGMLTAAGTPPTFEYAETLPTAVERAAARAETGDTVLLVPGCASFDMFCGFEHRGQVFRDAAHELGARIL